MGRALFWSAMFPSPSSSSMSKSLSSVLTTPTSCPSPFLSSCITSAALVVVVVGVSLATGGITPDNGIVGGVKILAGSIEGGGVW